MIYIRQVCFGLFCQVCLLLHEWQLVLFVTSMKQMPGMRSSEGFNSHTLEILSKASGQLAGASPEPLNCCNWAG